MKKRFLDFLLHCRNLIRVMQDEFNLTNASHYFVCGLCNCIMLRGEEVWHGYGECVDITDEHWERWESLAVAHGAPERMPA